MPIVRTAARTALGARQVVKDLGRVQAIVQVLARHGFGWLVASVEVPGIGLLRRFVSDETVESPTPERLAAVFRDLGPTFVKIGQILSTRTDVVPGEYALALEKLQDDVGSIPPEDVIEVVKEELGKAPAELFASFDPVPIATASIAQVHRARLMTGEEVAVKVQRPRIRDLIDTDLSILAFLARGVEAQIPQAALLDLPGVVAELRRSIADETDFRIEAHNMERFGRNFEERPDVVIPRVFRSLSGQHVLTMDFLEGLKIGKAREAGRDMRLVGERFLQAAFQMLLEDGWFHSDLHPGNVVVLPGERLGILDFGMVGRLTEEMRENLVILFFAIQRRDYRTVARVYFEIAVKNERVDYPAWEADVQELMERVVVGRSMAELHLEQFLRQLMHNALRHKVRVTPAYTMFFKAVVTTQGLAKTLLPEVDPLEEMMPYVQRMAGELLGPERLRQEAFYQLTSLRYTARRLPMVVGEVVSQLQEGKLRLRAVAEMAPEDRLRQERQSSRVALAVVFAGLSVGSSLALGSPGPRLLSLPAPATLGYALALAVLGLILRSVWNGR